MFEDLFGGWIFCVSITVWRKLEQDNAKINTDVCEHIDEEGERPEKCKWGAVNAMDELKINLGDLMNGIKSFNPLRIDKIHTAHRSDHRKG